jgi:putative FmdB family regulatory protein
LPLYEYKCVKCGKRFEKIEAFSASETKKCPHCGAKAERMFAAPAIQFKGSGWYVTDYAGKKSGAPANESSGDGSAKSAEKSGEAKPSDSKTSDSKPSDSKSSESKASESKSSGEKGSSKKKK